METNSINETPQRSEQREAGCTCGDSWPCPLHGGPPEQPPDTDDRVKEQGSRAVGPEWTKHTLGELSKRLPAGYHFGQLVADAHNAALSAMREDFAKATKQAAEALAVNHAKQLAAEREKVTNLQQWWESEKQAYIRCQDSLLQAQAAIARHNSATRPDCPWGIIESNLSALDKHDEDLKSEIDLWKRQAEFESEHREKYRNRIKPLVDVLREANRYVGRCIGEGTPEESNAALELSQRIDVLAKVKEGKSNRDEKTDPASV